MLHAGDLFGTIKRTLPNSFVLTRLGREILQPRRRNELHTVHGSLSGNPRWRRHAGRGALGSGGANEDFAGARLLCCWRRRLMLRNVVFAVFALLSCACTHAKQSIDGVRDLAQNIAWKECSRAAAKSGEVATLQVRIPSYWKLVNGNDVSIRLSNTDGNVVRLIEHVTKNEITISETPRRLIVAVLRNNRNAGALSVDLAADCITYAYFTLAQAEPGSH